MKKIIIIISSLTLMACSSLEKSNVSGVSVTVEKEGVAVSAEIQTDNAEKCEED